MDASVLQVQGIEQSRAWSEIEEVQPRLNVAMYAGIVFCLSAALWLGLYTAFVALLG